MSDWTPMDVDVAIDVVAAQPLVRLRFTKEVLRVAVNVSDTLAVLTGKKSLSVGDFLLPNIALAPTCLRDRSLV